MSDSEQNIPDDFWQKAFEKAAEPPPPRVWDAIERRLDNDEGTKILPLWRAGLAPSRPVVWSTGVAAAVALLLLGWWALQTTAPENRDQIARQQASVQTGHVATSAIPDNRPTNSPLEQPTKRLPTVGQEQDRDEQRLVASGENPGFRPRNGQRSAPVQSPTVPLNDPQPAQAQAIAESLVEPASEQVAVAPGTTGSPQVADTQPAQAARQTQEAAAVALQANVVQDDAVKNERVLFMTNSPVPTTAARSVPSVSISSAVTERALSFEPVATLALRLRGPGAIQRIVWFRSADPVMETAVAVVQPKREARAMWASVSLMPGAFNPSVAVRSAQPSSFVKADALSNTAASQPSVSSRANVSVSYQAGAGIQLTERWSVESGVGYLAGRSTVESPAQVSVLNLQSAYPNMTAQRTNLYVDALRVSLGGASSGASNSFANFDNSAISSRYSVQNNYSPQERQSLTNDYHFVQVPVQVGYQLRPRKRLSLALLGGFLSNIFVRNTVGDNLVVTTRDGVYRPVSWAATMGARFRYRPSRQWSASLAGVYQPALGPGTRPESAVQTHPTTAGVSFGVDYHF